MNLQDALINEEELSDVETKHHTPEGLFTGSTKDIVDGLLKDANGDEELALKRINFYINRAGDGLSNKTAVHSAKKELEKKVEERKESIKSSKFNAIAEQVFTEIDVPSNKYLSRIAHISATHPNEPSTVTYNKSTDVITHNAQPKYVEDYAQDKFGIPTFCWDPKFVFYQKRFGLNNPIRLAGIYNTLGLGRHTERDDVLVVNYAVHKLTDDEMDSMQDSEIASHEKDYDFKVNQNRLYNQYITAEEFKDCFTKDLNDPYVQKNAKILADWMNKVQNGKSRHKSLLGADRVENEHKAQNQAFDVFKNYYEKLWQGSEIQKITNMLSYMSKNDPEKWDKILYDYLVNMPEGKAAQLVYAKKVVNDLDMQIKDILNATKKKKATAALDHIIDFDGE